MSRIFIPAVAAASGADRSSTPPAPSSGGNTVQGNGVASRRRARTTNGSRRISDYPIYSDSASAGRRVIPDNTGPHLSRNALSD